MSESCPAEGLMPRCAMAMHQRPSTFAYGSIRSVMAERRIHYERCAFATRLHTNRLYTASHTWLNPQGEGLWRIGLTKFATRVLGEPVEYDFEVEPAASVESGQVIGWIEGFKAVSDLYCSMSGRFRGENPLLADNISVIHSDPFGQGWLYLVEGTPGNDCLDVHGYVALLDTTIDRMKRGQA